MTETSVLLASEVKILRDRHPSQIVLRQVRAKTFATHMKVYPPGEEPYFILGRYFFNFEDAEADFYKRSKEIDGP